MTTRESELVTTVIAHCVVLRDLIDELKTSKPYYLTFQKIRNMTNGLSRELTNITDGLFDDMPSNIVDDVAEYIDLADSYTKAISSNKAKILKLLIDEMDKGNIAAIEDDQHQKMFNQLDKV